MIIRGKAIMLDGCEPVFRTCSRCNPYHRNLLNPESDTFYTCFACGASWVFGRFLDTFKCEEEMIQYIAKKLEKFKLPSEIVKC